MPEAVDRVNARPTLSVREHCRVVVDNDFAGDPDGLVALAHHLLSPANRVVAITSSFLNPRFATKDDGEKVGAALAEELLDETYRRCAYSVAELESDIGGSGRLGEWLWSHFTSPPDWVRIGGVWPFGDSPPLLVTALTVESSTFTTRTTDDGGERRVYTDVDVRLLVGDLLARLHLHDAATDPNGLSHPEEMR